MQCHAKSKQTGKQCQSLAVKGKRVCRMHGAFGGIKTAEGKEKQRAAVTKHGLYTKHTIEESRKLRQLIKEARAILNEAS